MIMCLTAFFVAETIPVSRAAYPQRRMRARGAQEWQNGGLMSAPPATMIRPPPKTPWTARAPAGGGGAVFGPPLGSAAAVKEAPEPPPFPRLPGSPPSSQLKALPSDGFGVPEAWPKAAAAGAALLAEPCGPSEAAGSRPFSESPPQQRRSLPLLRTMAAMVPVPSLCPHMVLKDCDTHLTLPMCALASAEVGSGFSVKGALLRPAFQVDMGEAVGGGRCLRLFVPMFQQEAPWAVVQPLREGREEQRLCALKAAPGGPGLPGSPRSALEIVKSDGSFFGLLVAQEEGVWWMVHSTMAMLTLEGNRKRRVLTVSAGADERFLGSATPGDEAGVEQQLHVCVKPNADPLLVLACTMAVLLLL